MISKQQIEMIRLRNSKRNGQLKRLKKAPKWLEPLTAERGYTASLYLYTFQIRKAITEELIPQIPKWLTLATMTYPDPVDPIKNDDIIDDVIQELNDTLLFIEELLVGPQIKAIEAAEQSGIAVARFNQVQYNRSINSVLDVDIFVEEPWLETQLELYANQNAQLITNMTNNEIERVSGIVQRGLQEGSSLEAITESIEKSFGITRRHAKLIARDQTTKLNGSLTKLRQQNIGVTTYRWLTAGDERVRQSHRVLDNKICRWDDPTVYLDEETGKWVKRSTIGGTEVHPSQDVNCFLGIEEVISFDTIKKIFRRFYTGEVIELITEEGFSFKSTPNHPVLTQKGWIAVNKVDVGDNIICAGNQGFKAIEMNIQEKKSTFYDLFASIEKIFPFDTSISCGQFHGDISNNEVDVISINSKLVSKWDVESFKSFEKFLFAFSDYLSTQINLSFDSSIETTINRLTVSPQRFICVFSKLLSLINSQFRNSIIHSFTSISNYDAILDKSIFDSSTAGVISLRQLLNTESLSEQNLKFINRELFNVFVEATSSIFGSINTPTDKFLSQSFTGTIEDFTNMQDAIAFKIKTCCVVEKRSGIVSTHVYNLETIKGYYGICKEKTQAIFHNCRCQPIAQFEDMFNGN